MIAQEAGGFVTGSKDVPHDGVVTEAILTGRRYLVIRGVAGTSVRAEPLHSLPRSERTNLFLIPYFLSSCPAIPSIHPGGGQSRRAKAYSAGILRYSRGYPPRRINKIGERKCHIVAITGSGGGSSVVVVHIACEYTSLSKSR